mmetsp:Transcript_4017/g.10181  ORF Transcript_4017/g.10181 Transcript_4017/m.10181 type:complete len:224 (+) Transcript_4017:840-1511(+)
MLRQQFPSLVRIRIRDLLQLCDNVVHLSLIHALQRRCNGLAARHSRNPAAGWTPMMMMPIIRGFIVVMIPSSSAPAASSLVLSCDVTKIHTQLIRQRFQVAAVRKIHAYPPPVDLVLVHVPYGRQRRLRILELHEREAARLAGLEVGYHADLYYPSQLREGRVELLFGGGEGEVADEDVVLLAGGVGGGGVHRADAGGRRRGRLVAVVAGAATRGWIAIPHYN